MARRPTKTEACAKVEPHTERREGGPLYYCGKHFEKPRVRVGDAAILEDERRPGLWRLHLPRNCAHVNGRLVALAMALGANTDCQPVLTAKGVADYVSKYITKYGAGMSVTSRISSLLDDIVSRCNTETLTIASLLSKAFIATAVPDALCGLEAWHILWELPRTVCSRYFKSLNMDGLQWVKPPKEVARKAEWEFPKKISRGTPVKVYTERMRIPCRDAALKAQWPTYTLQRFHSEVDFMNGSLHRRSIPRVLRMKPYLPVSYTHLTLPTIYSV